MPKSARPSQAFIAGIMALLLVWEPAVLAQNPPQPPPVVVPPGFGPRLNPNEAKPQPQAPAEAKPAPAQAPKTEPAPPPPIASGQGTFGGLNLQNVSLVEVVDFLARQLKINYIIDPRVRGGVTINTYGETKDIEPRALLDTILRINGAAMVQTGQIYRIVPLADLQRMPLKPNVDESKIPEDDQAMLNLIFLKYANVEELSKLVEQFVGPEGRTWAYPPANLLLVLDSRRSMRRLMELISLFDSDALAKQRVRLYETKNSRPSQLAKDLESLLKSMSLSKDLSAVKFIPIDRINTVIAVAPNPGAFQQIEEWIAKLDVKVENASDKIDTYVYRVKYQSAPMLAGAIMSLFLSFYPGMAYGMMGGMMGMGGMYGGMGGMYGGMGSGGMYPGMGGMMGGANMYGMYGGMNPYMQGGGMGMQGGLPNTSIGNVPGPLATASGLAGIQGAGVTPAGVGAPSQAGPQDLTGAYLGSAMYPGMPLPRSPRIVPNPMDNTLLILATRDEYESIDKMLRELDVPPRQVLIEARIYEISLTGALSAGVSAFLDRQGSIENAPATRQVVGRTNNNGLNLSIGTLVGQSRELLAFLRATENTTRTRVISAPSIIATDSIPASINVGLEVPTLSSQAVTGVQQGGSSLFANTIQNRSTGVTLSLTARVNPTGVVTLEIDQDVSAPQAPSTSTAIQSPSFSRRNVKTRVTVQDGDTIAIGGIITEQEGSSSSGVPYLHRIPVLGFVFGGKAVDRARTELVVFLTPRVIYDTNAIADATDEIVSKFKRLQKLIPQQ